MPSLSYSFRSVCKLCFTRRYTSAIVRTGSWQSIYLSAWSVSFGGSLGKSCPFHRHIEFPRSYARASPRLRTRCGIIYLSEQQLALEVLGYWWRSVRPCDRWDVHISTGSLKVSHCRCLQVQVLTSMLRWYHVPAKGKGTRKC